MAFSARGVGVHKGFLNSAIALATAVLAGCGGGGVGIGDGQGPDPVVLDVPIAYIQRPVPLDDQG